MRLFKLNILIVRILVQKMRYLLSECTYLRERLGNAG